MADMLAGLAKEFAEQFIFAKVDIDENPGLREQYKIENIPTLVVFHDGEAVHTEVGQLQEVEARLVLFRAHRSYHATPTTSAAAP